MNYIHAMTIAAMCICAIEAEAQSPSQAFYSECLSQAEIEYKECHQANRRGAGCRNEYRHEKDRCWNAYKHIAQSDAYYFMPYGGNARFEPIPIPQRPVYILPGMN